MVNGFGEAIAVFVAMPETRHSTAKEHNTTNINRKRAASHRKIDLRINKLFL